METTKTTWFIKDLRNNVEYDLSKYTATFTSDGVIIEIWYRDDESYNFIPNGQYEKYQRTDTKKIWHQHTDLTFQQIKELLILEEKYPHPDFSVELEEARQMIAERKSAFESAGFAKYIDKDGELIPNFPQVLRSEAYIQQYAKAFAETIDDTYDITHDVIVYWAKLAGIDFKDLNTEGLVPIKLITDCPITLCMDYMWEVHLPTGKSAHQCDLYSYTGATDMFSGGYEYDSSKQEEFNKYLASILKQWYDKFITQNPSLEDLGLLVINTIFYLFTDKFL